MNRFRISRQAEQDLQDIWLYLCKQEEVIKTTQVRIPALMRSVEEIKLEWS